MTMFLMLMLMMTMYMLNTPISSILILILITILISLMTSHILYTSWLSLIIFLMMVGGMLILFLYSASVSPNKKSLNISKSTLTKLFFCFLLYYLFLPQSIMSLQSINNPILIFSMINNPPLMIFSITYLLLFLFMMTLILKKKSGPLRSQ